MAGIAADKAAAADTVAAPAADRAAAAAVDKAAAAAIDIAVVPAAVDKTVAAVGKHSRNRGKRPYCRHTPDDIFHKSYLIYSLLVFPLFITHLSCIIKGIFLRFSDKHDPESLIRFLSAKELHILMIYNFTARFPIDCQGLLLAAQNPYYI